jgi:hypothetical protein
LSTAQIWECTFIRQGPGDTCVPRLECVYYSAPVPVDAACLTTLCLVFDKIYFPNVYLPKGDYDRELLQREIERLESVAPDSKVTGILKFLEYRAALDGILEYPTSRDAIFGSDDTNAAALARIACFLQRYLGHDRR